MLLLLTYPHWCYFHFLVSIWEKPSMAIVKSTIAFGLGAAISFFLPGTIGAIVLASTLWFDPDPSPFTGAGPECHMHKRQAAVSPDGRFVAYSLVAECDDDRTDNTNNYIFVMSTRLNRGAHVATISGNASDLGLINWPRNGTLDLTINSGVTTIFASSWCDTMLTINRVTP